MSIVQYFGNSEIRFVSHPESKFEFGIVADDMAAILEASAGKDIARYVDNEWKGALNQHTPGGTQAMTVIWEPGIYQLLAKSRKPQAKPFQKWLFEEVLPNIRKTGQYQSQPQSQPQQLPSDTAIALAGLDAVFGGIINPNLLAGVKLNAIAALHPGANLALEEGRKFLSHTSVSKAQLLTPTEIGKRLGISGRKVNELLVDAGLQTKNLDTHKGSAAYLPTDRGMEFAEFTIVTGRKSDNTSYQHLKWYESVLDVMPIAAYGIDPKKYGDHSSTDLNDLQPLWQQVLAHLPPVSQVLLKQQGTLISVQKHEVRLGFRSQNLIKLVEPKLPQIKSAFGQVLGRVVQVHFEISGDSNISNNLQSF